ncbi:hypothetical protein [Chryseolinea sp. H1M3-3]|uniref:hypothetical protein n=1 Tax=Chryseolinea sp. H1M3-3 TaxID=3034144 RepID=UPI0023EB7BD8|nr:hypothetical protein [Chryseolinea sp. H1M3-3]
MRLTKVNTFVKKYQPLIQTVGIVLILITVVLTWLQISIARKEFEFNEQGRAYDFAPGWKIGFTKNESNALIDELSITTVNDAYNVQKLRIQILDGITPYEFEGVGTNISTSSLKARLSSIYKKHYNLENLDCRGCYEEDSYPIAVTIFYERFGERQDTTILYDYHFKTYFSKQYIKFNSQALEFVKYVAKDSASLTRELLTYNLSSSFFSNISDAAFQIRLAIVLRDPVLKPIAEYAYSNVNVYKNSVVFVTEKTGERIGEFVLMMPQPLYDSVAIVQRKVIVRELNKNIEKYDETITSAIQEIQEFEKEFCKCKAETNLDSLMNRKTIVGNKQQWDEWARMNSELVNLVTKRVKV